MSKDFMSTTEPKETATGEETGQAIDTRVKRNIKTRIHTYSFDVGEPEQLKAWSELCDRMKAQGIKMHESWGGKSSHYSFVADLHLNGQEIELETTHMFSDQWNTAPVPGSENGLRVFEWAKDYPIDFPKRYKKGHYLEVTDEMRAFQRDWHACGYCGHQYHKSGVPAFCTACLDGPHLEVKNLPLLRPLPILESFGGKRPELTDSERAELMPRYVEAQTKGGTERGKARLEKQRRDLIEGAKAKIETAATERDGMLWLMDHGLKIDNCIYYSHTRRFSFGWRQPVEKEVESAILEHMSEFPFLYEIKCADGRILNNEE